MDKRRHITTFTFPLTSSTAPRKRDGDTGNKRKCTRRALVIRTPAIAATAALIVSERISGNDIHAELAELASKIPGLGQADVFFPSFFKGEWRVQRELYEVEADSARVVAAGDDAVLGAGAIEALRRRVGRRDEFKIRFYRHRGHIVEDRAYNTRNEVAFELANFNVSAKWQPDNPNLITVTGSPSGIGTGVMREVRFTKRAFADAPQGYGTFFSSEYARVVDLDDEAPLGAPPHITAWRRISYVYNTEAQRMHKLTRRQSIPCPFGATRQERGTYAGCNEQTHSRLSLCYR